MAWLSGYNHRKKHVILAQSGAGTLYPIGIKVYKGSGTDGTETVRTTVMGKVYVGNGIQNDFDDIRFTMNDGTTPLSYWREQISNGTFAVFWVKMEDNLNTNPATICVYYENPLASRGDDPQSLDIMSLREYDTYASWSPDITYTKTDATVLRCQSSAGGLGAGLGYIHLPKAYLNGKKIRIYWRAYYDYANPGQTCTYLYLTNVAMRRYAIDLEMLDGQNDYRYLTPYYYSVTLTSLYAAGGWSSWTEWTSGVLDMSNFSSDVVTLLVQVGDAWSARYPAFEVDYIKILDASDNVLKTIHLLGSIVMEQTGGTRDYGLCRKKTTPEPSHSTWGSEEQPPFLTKNVYEDLNFTPFLRNQMSLLRAEALDLQRWLRIDATYASEWSFQDGLSKRVSKTFQEDVLLSSVLLFRMAKFLSERTFLSMDDYMEMRISRGENLALVDSPVVIYHLWRGFETLTLRSLMRKGPFLSESLHLVSTTTRHIFPILARLVVYLKSKFILTRKTVEVNV